MSNRPRTWFLGAGLGLINPLLYYPILLAGYDRLPAQVAQPLNYTWALWMALLSIPLLGQRLKPDLLLGTGLALLGVVLLSRGDTRTEPIDPMGVALILASALLWAGYWLLLTRLTPKAGAGAPAETGSILAVGFYWGTPLLVLWTLWQDGLPAFDLRVLGAMVWIGCIEMGVTFLLWQRALRLAREPARIGQLIFISPLLALAPIHFLLDEPIRPAAVAALVLILTGTALAQRLPGSDGGRT